MTLRNLASRVETRIRCLLGDHELVTDLVEPKPETETEPAVGAIVRLRCLHCLTTTPGWELSRPAYRRTYDAKTEDLTLENPKLAARLAAEAAAEPVAATGGGGRADRRNVTKFPVAKKRRTR